MKKNQNYKSLKVFKNKHTKNQDDFSMLNRQYIEELFDGKKVLEEEVSTIKHSNPNILINGNFQVNQRGKTSYSSSSSSVIYAVDRWCFSKMSGSTCVVEKNKVTLTASGSSRNDFFMQYVANPSFYSDRTVTLSVSYQNLKGKFALGIWDGSSFSQTAWATANNGTITLTKTIQSSCTSLSCEFLKDLETNISIEILYAKLEIGKIATAFYQRNYDEELELCKPYFVRLKAKSSYTVFATGISCSTTKSIVFIPHRMRTSPAVSYSGSIKILNSSSYKTVSSVSVDSFGSFGVALACTGSSYTSGQGALLSSQNDSSAYIDLDAEMR